MNVNELMARAVNARRNGQYAEAEALFREILQSQIDYAPALNGLGLTLIELGRSAEALNAFKRAIEIDPNAPPLWLNLAEAARHANLPEQELEAINGALHLDAYLLPALLKKALVLERLGRLEESARTYRGLLMTTPDDSGLPENIRSALEHGRKVIEAVADARSQNLSMPLEDVYRRYPGERFDRVKMYMDNKMGRREIYQPKPTSGHFPFIPAPEFFDNSLFPWFAHLEAGTSIIRDELKALLNAKPWEFRPYVAYSATDPVNQWDELNHSERWSSWFFWKDGAAIQESHSACPRTAALLATLPMLDIPSKAPSVMFSLLAPRTRIPPHHGSSNVRVTVHLPLIVPDGCGFRVGGETRQWREGEVWAFDDTIEHEAWNDSDEPRAILILDAWNPYLTEAEKAAVRIIG